MYIRTVKVHSSNGTLNEYVRVVEAYRQDGKVKQRVVADLGRKDVLAGLLPKLRRVLEGQPSAEAEAPEELQILEASTWGPSLVVRALFEELGLWGILDEHLGDGQHGGWADRAFVLLANRLIHPSSEHALAGWLETDFVCDRQGRRFLAHWHRRGRVRVHHRQLDRWYRTLDRLLKAKGKIELALYHRLRDLFSLRPDLVLYDLTSTYFEGDGPQELAKHGYSRDGKPRNVQVIVGLVMVAGWPIAHHVWEGNRLDHRTLQEVLADLRRRFEFGRVIFVGDRGMVTEENLEGLLRQGQGYLVGLRRRRNEKLDQWLAAIDDDRWLDCPLGKAAAEKEHPPRTRVQEVPSGEPGLRVLIVESEERRQYEQAMRQRAMQASAEKLAKLQKRLAAGKLVDAAKIGAAAERILQAHHGHRYFSWDLRQGQLHFQQSPLKMEREKRLEGKYVIATSEKQLGILEAVMIYKQLTEVERGFRQLKDVLGMRPIWHRVAPRVRAHIFVAALGLLLSRLLERRLKAAGVDLSVSDALQAVSTIRLVRFGLEGQSDRCGVSAGSPRGRQVLKALGLGDLRPPTAPVGEPTVM